MDNSPEIKTQDLGSLILASLGWLATAGIVIWFFGFAKQTYFQQGYQAGVESQNVIDKAKYEEAFGQPVNAQPEEGVVNVRVISTKPGSVLAEEISFGTANPFNGAPKQHTIIVSDQTKIVRRVVIDPQEYERRRNAAVAKGENPLLIPPFDDFPATFADIVPGKRLEVVAQDSRATSNASFAAQFIAIVDEASIPQEPPKT